MSNPSPPELPYGSIAVGYDDGMRLMERYVLSSRRQVLIPQAEGDVLEIGAGTGVNLRYYGQVHSLTLSDPDPLMIRQARAKPQPQGVAVRFEIASAEDLPYGDAGFDTVVSTLAFCTIPHPEKALAEIKRVLRPEGKLLMLEHVRPLPAALGLVADWLTPLQKRLCGGCRLNRQTMATVEAQGFRVLKVTRSGFGILALIEAVR